MCYEDYEDPTRKVKKSQEGLLSAGVVRTMGGVLSARAESAESAGVAVAHMNRMGRNLKSEVHAEVLR